MQRTMLYKYCPYDQNDITRKMCREFALKRFHYRQQSPVFHVNRNEGEGAPTPYPLNPGPR